MERISSCYNDATTEDLFSKDVLLLLTAKNPYEIFKYK